MSERKVGPVEENPSLTPDVQGTTGGPVVKTFDYGGKVLGLEPQSGQMSVGHLQSIKVVAPT